MRGTPAELLTLRGHYAALHRQFGQVDEHVRVRVKPAADAS